MCVKRETQHVDFNHLRTNQYVVNVSLNQNLSLHKFVEKFIGNFDLFLQLLSAGLENGFK